MVVVGYLLELLEVVFTIIIDLKIDLSDTKKSFIARFKSYRLKGSLVKEFSTKKSIYILNMDRSIWVIPRFYVHNTTTSKCVTFGWLFIQVGRLRWLS